MCVSSKPSGTTARHSQSVHFHIPMCCTTATNIINNNSSLWSLQIDCKPRRRSGMTSDYSKQLLHACGCRGFRWRSCSRWWSVSYSIAPCRLLKNTLYRFIRIKYTNRLACDVFVAFFCYSYELRMYLCWYASEALETPHFIVCAIVPSTRYTAGVR